MTTAVRTGTCNVTECVRPSFSAYGVCRMHYERWRKRGTFERPTRFEYPANPWAGERACPRCQSVVWTLPWQPGLPLWRCVMCHLDFEP